MILIFKYLGKTKCIKQTASVVMQLKALRCQHFFTGNAAINWLKSHYFLCKKITISSVFHISPETIKRMQGATSGSIDSYTRCPQQVIHQQWVSHLLSHFIGYFKHNPRIQTRLKPYCGRPLSNIGGPLHHLLEHRQVALVMIYCWKALTLR